MKSVARRIIVVFWVAWHMSPMITHAETAADPVVLMAHRQALRQSAESAANAARALAAMGPAAEAALPELVYALQYDDPATVADVERAFVAIGAPAVNALIRSLQSPNFLIRARAARSLSGIGPDAQRAAPALVALITEANFEVRDAAEAALKAIGEPSISALEAALKRDKTPGRKAYIDLLPAFGPKASPALIAVLEKDDNPYLRASAAAALAGIVPPVPQTVPALVKRLYDIQESVRSEAADALGQLGPHARAALGPLLIRAQTEPDALARQKASLAAAAIGKADVSSLPGLSAALRHESPEVRRSALSALVGSDIPWASLSPLVEGALADSDPLLRQAAVQATASSSGDASSRLLILKRALDDASPDVRTPAIQALGAMSEQPDLVASELSRLLSDSNPAIRQEVIRSLGRLGKAGVPGLVLALQDSYSVLADEAGRQLVAIGPDALPELQNLSNVTDTKLKKRTQDLIRRIQSKKISR